MHHSNIQSAGFSLRPAQPNELAAIRSHILTVLDHDLKIGYTPEWHWDLDHMQEVYLDHPRHTLIVAIDDTTAEVIGTIAVRAGGPRPPYHPQWLIERYSVEDTAQLFRVYIAQEHRRRGVARQLVQAARAFILADGGYRVIYLHTDPSVPAAEAFWRSLPTEEIYDNRAEQGRFQTLHFELSLHEPIG